MNTPQNVGFIGLGMMGTPMTQCLKRAGFPLFLADADAARETALCAELSCTALTAENAASLDVLITMLPNSKIVESVLLGDKGEGWTSRLKPGAIIIDMSSSEPARSRDLAGKLKELGFDYLDAPVSGGVRKAKDGSLAILVGGQADVLAQCRNVLEAMGKSLLHIGPAGSGHAAKALNNYVSAAGLMATVEALHIAERFGIAPEAMADVLNASTGRSNTSENKVKQFMLNGSYASGFALQLMNKDLKIARALSEAVDYPMTFGVHCTDIWDAASQRSTPTTDHTEMYRLLGNESR